MFSARPSGVVKRVVGSIGMVVISVACSRAVVAPTTTAVVPTRVLTPYLTSTPRPTQQVAISPPVTTLTPEPTATPFTYTVVEGDTLLAIAYQFGVTVDEIMAANPGIIPQILSIGQSVVIPLGDGELGVIPTPTPLTVIFKPPQCYPSSEGGWWCYLLVENGRNQGIEGVSAKIDLYTASGELNASRLAIPPVNVIPAQGQLPLMAYFPAPTPAQVYPQGRIVTAFSYSREPVRYLPAQLEIDSLKIFEGGLSGQVQGRIAVTTGGEQPVFVEVVVALVGYEEGGEVVGVRRWVDEIELVESEAGIPFEVQLFSMGPPIEDINVAVEVRPIHSPVEE